MAKILIVEDEIDLAELIAINITREGHTASIALNGEEALARISADRPDLVILDLMIPGLTGVEVCKYLRRKETMSQIPVIMVTARGEEADRVIGFESGADDYVVKPFSVRELMLRIKAKLSYNEDESRGRKIFDFGTLKVDMERYMVSIDGNEIILTTTEFKLLTALAKTSGTVHSRDSLLHDVWGDTSGDIDYRTVDTHITRLRNKLGDLGDLIKTVRGFGYKLAEPLHTLQ